MQPINETLIHFFNSYGGSSHNTTIETYELRDMEGSPRLFNTLTCPMDINSLIANIDGISSEINDESKGCPIELIDKRTGRSIYLQSSDVRTYLSYRIEVTVSLL